MLVTFRLALKTKKEWSSLVAQWAKDPALSLQQLGSLPWCRFNPWPRKFHMLQEQPKEKKKDKGWKKTFYFYLLLFCFFLFRATSAAYGSSLPRGPMGATAAGLFHSHSNLAYELHLRPTLQFMSILDPLTH